MGRCIAERCRSGRGLFNI